MRQSYRLRVPQTHRVLPRQNAPKIHIRLVQMIGQNRCENAPSRRFCTARIMHLVRICPLSVRLKVRKYLRAFFSCISQKDDRLPMGVHKVINYVQLLIVFG
jgi:hypothetical protein